MTAITRPETRSIFDPRPIPYLDRPICPVCGINCVGYWSDGVTVRFDPKCADCGYDPAADAWVAEDRKHQRSSNFVMIKPPSRVVP